MASSRIIGRSSVRDVKRVGGIPLSPSKVLRSVTKVQYTDTMRSLPQGQAKGSRGTLGECPDEEQDPARGLQVRGFVNFDTVADILSERVDPRPVDLIKGTCPLRSL